MKKERIFVERRILDTDSSVVNFVNKLINASSYAKYFVANFKSSEAISMGNKIFLDLTTIVDLPLDRIIANQPDSQWDKMPGVMTLPAGSKLHMTIRQSDKAMHVILGCERVTYGRRGKTKLKDNKFNIPWDRNHSLDKLTTNLDHLIECTHLIKQQVETGYYQQLYDISLSRINQLQTLPQFKQLVDQGIIKTEFEDKTHGDVTKLSQSYYKPKLKIMTKDFPGISYEVSFPFVFGQHDPVYSQATSYRLESIITGSELFKCGRFDGGVESLTQYKTALDELIRQLAILSKVVNNVILFAKRHRWDTFESATETVNETTPAELVTP